MKFTRQIVTNDLTDRGFYVLDSALDSLVDSYNERNYPVFYGHNYNEIDQYVAYSCKGTAKKKKEGLNIEFNTLETDNGKLFDKMLSDPEVPMGFSVAIKINDYEFDESSGLVNIKDCEALEFSGTPIPTDKNTFSDCINVEFSGYEDNSLIASFAKWDTKYINDLPNECFAVVEKDYLSGKVEDKRARHLPYKSKEGSVDLPHLRNALARMSQIEAIGTSETSEELRIKAKKLLTKVAKEHLKDTKWGKMEDDRMEVDPKIAEQFAEYLRNTSANKQATESAPTVVASVDPAPAVVEPAQTQVVSEVKTYTQEEITKLIDSAVSKEMTKVEEKYKNDKVVVYGGEPSTQAQDKKLDWAKFLHGEF
jgi:hypothetical protein